MNHHPTFMSQYLDMVSQMESSPERIRDIIAETFHKSLADRGELRNARLLHAAMGCVTEAAEFLDQMKKVVAYGKIRDDVNIKEELGDILWYVGLACNVLDTDFFELMALNEKKLRTRYPDQFKEANALQRDLAAERQALETSPQQVRDPGFGCSDPGCC